MFTPGSSIHAYHYSDATKDSDGLAQITYSGPAILRDERCSHAAEIAAEMRAHAGSHDRIDAMVTRFSRFAGIGLFALSLGGVGWAVTGWL